MGKEFFVFHFPQKNRNTDPLEFLCLYKSDAFLQFCILQAVVVKYSCLRTITFYYHLEQNWVTNERKEMLYDHCIDWFRNKTNRDVSNKNPIFLHLYVNRVVPPPDMRLLDSQAVKYVIDSSLRTSTEQSCCISLQSF